LRRQVQVKFELRGRLAAAAGEHRMFQRTR
jgi:hypothetical protein